MNPILRDFAIFTTVTVEVVGFTGAGLLLGRWLSESHGLPRWTLVITAVLGLCVAIFRIIRRTPRGDQE